MNAHLTPDELRELFLFADLTPEQLEWIAGCGDVVEVPAGSNVVDEGEPSRCFYVLLSGTVSMSRVIGGETVETTRTDHRGSYFGAVQFYLQDDESAREYPASVRAITDCVVLALPAKEFAKRFAQWFPMAVHLLEGMLLGMRRGNQQLAERERLLALGKLSAGLTHELNNPAAAAIRATDALRDKVTGMRNKLAMIADGRIAGPALRKLVMAQDEFVKKVRHAPDALPAGSLRPRGRAGRLVRRARHRTAAGTSRRCSWRAGWASRTWRPCPPRARAGWWRARSAGWPTRSRARASCARSSTPPRGSPTSSARRSSTRSSTARRSASSTSTRVSTPRW